MFHARAAALVAAIALPGAAPAADPLAFKDADRVVLLGGAVIEREQQSGQWELALALKNRGTSVVFRNLGWSGDTVHGDARGRFDYADSKKRFDALVNPVRELRPTVVVVCYGQNESFDGPAGVSKFAAGLDKLLGALAAMKARVVLVTPPPFELAAGLRDPAARNADLALYRDATLATAAKHKLESVDLFGRLQARPKGRDPLTDNGVHLTPAGYRETAAVLVPGVVIGPDSELARLKIVEKNRLFFFRWRPQNETYLTGFRKHEQGNNAAEVADFDPLVAAADKAIHELLKAAK